MEQAFSNQSTRRRFTAKEMFDLIGMCKSSGQSVQTFCKLHGLTEATYYYWQKKYTDQKKNATEPAEGNFSLIKLSGALSNNEGPVLFAEVGGIRLYREVPASYLKELIR